MRDPVAAGEMDECGGHTGRGDDYHYHSTPTCLLEEVEQGAIAGYMLGRVPIYASQVDGSAEFNGCSGFISPDGLLHYAFLDEFPYATSMLGEFNEGPKQAAPMFTVDPLMQRVAAQ